MIRLVHCVKRRPELSVAEFRRFWNSSEFDALLAKLQETSAARRLQKSLTLLIDVNLQLMQERKTEEPFDALLEFCWDNARELETRIESRQMQDLLAEMEAYQRQFIDFSHSRRFFTDWAEAADPA